MYHQMWTVEYTPIQLGLSTYNSEINSNVDSMTSFKAYSSFNTPQDLQLDATSAHDVFGHLNGEALSNLHKACAGLKFTGGKVDPNCEICRLGNATQRISRIPKDVVNKPFHTLCWDIIYQDKAFDNQTKLSHLWDPYLKFHFVYGLLLTGRVEIISTLLYTFNYIKTQYGIDVKVLCIDGETSLVNNPEFTRFRDNRGIEVRVSTPHTKQQHGAAERSGGVLTLRATKLHLSSRIPKRFWRYIYKTAGYLLNRSPTRSLGWKSPIAVLNEHLKKDLVRPKCYHLKPYGCKAYAYIHGRPNLDKLGAKASVGYLVGYLSTNI